MLFTLVKISLIGIFCLQVLPPKQNLIGLKCYRFLETEPTNLLILVVCTLSDTAFHSKISYMNHQTQKKKRVNLIYVP